MGGVDAVVTETRNNNNNKNDGVHFPGSGESERVQQCVETVRGMRSRRETRGRWTVTPVDVVPMGWQCALRDSVLISRTSQAYQKSFCLLLMRTEMQPTLSSVSRPEWRNVDL